MCFQARAVYCPDKPPFEWEAIISSNAMLVQASKTGQIKELWQGMDKPNTTRPEILNINAWGQIRKSDGSWLDLRELNYSYEGSRPGLLNMVSQDGQVHIRITSRRIDAPFSPIFVTYKFKKPVDFRYIAKFEQSIHDVRVDDTNGLTAVTTDWLIDHKKYEKRNPLILASLPSGTGYVNEDSVYRQVDNTEQVLIALCAGKDINLEIGQNYVQAWLDILGDVEDTLQQRDRKLVRIHTGISDLDKMFEASIDSVDILSFGSGVSLADAQRYKDSWIRDGTYSMVAMSLAGEYETVEKFFKFWIEEGGFSVGGETEAQQPAIMIMGIWYYSRFLENNTSYLKKVFPYITKYADYYSRRIYREGMLHLSDEWIGNVLTSTTWPNSEICGGLKAASNIASELGYKQQSIQWLDAHNHLKQKIRLNAYDLDIRKIIPWAGWPNSIYVNPKHTKPSYNGPMRDTRTDSGMFILVRSEIFGRGFAAFEVDSSAFAATQAWIAKDLQNENFSVSRYGPNAESPNFTHGDMRTWPISMGWAAQAEWLRGRTDRGWRYLIDGILKRKGYDAQTALYCLPETMLLDGRLSETRLLNWSHGEFVISTILLLTGFYPDVENADFALCPSLPPGSDSGTVEGFHYKGWTVDLALKRGAEKIDVELVATRESANAPETLKLFVENGRIIKLHDGDTVTFKGMPSKIQDQFTRTDNAFERANLYSEILLNKSIPDNMRGDDVKELENKILQIEDLFNDDFLPDILKDRLEYIRNLRKATIEISI